MARAIETAKSIGYQYRGLKQFGPDELDFIALGTVEARPGGVKVTAHRAIESTGGYVYVILRGWAG
jgi:hypothetical protein